MDANSLDNADYFNLDVHQRAPSRAPNGTESVARRRATRGALAALGCWPTFWGARSFRGVLHGWSAYALILKSRRPIPWASYQCCSRRTTLPERRIGAQPLRFRQRPLPWALLSRTRTRTPAPTAIVSTCSISPMISNCTPQFSMIGSGLASRAHDAESAARRPALHAARRLHSEVRPLVVEIFEPYPLPRRKSRPRRRDSLQELRVVLESVVEPIVVGRETDDDARRSSVARDDDLFRGRQAQVVRQIIFRLRQRHRSRRACRRRRATLARRAFR